jgi:hypothetical protein
MTDPTTNKPVIRSGLDVLEAFGVGTFIIDGTSRQGELRIDEGMGVLVWNDFDVEYVVDGKTGEETEQIKTLLIRDEAGEPVIGFEKVEGHYDISGELDHLAGIPVGNYFIGLAPRDKCRFANADRSVRGMIAAEVARRREWERTTGRRNRTPVRPASKGIKIPFGDE